MLKPSKNQELLPPDWRNTTEIQVKSFDGRRGCWKVASVPQHLLVQSRRPPFPGSFWACSGPSFLHQGCGERDIPIPRLPTKWFLLSMGNFCRVWSPMQNKGLLWSASKLLSKPLGVRIWFLPLWAWQACLYKLQELKKQANGLQAQRRRLRASANNRRSGFLARAPSAQPRAPAGGSCPPHLNCTC